MSNLVFLSKTINNLKMSRTDDNWICQDSQESYTFYNKLCECKNSYTVQKNWYLLLFRRYPLGSEGMFLIRVECKYPHSIKWHCSLPNICRMYRSIEYQSQMHDTDVRGKYA